jgi:hypothetical protein
MRRSESRKSRSCRRLAGESRVDIGRKLDRKRDHGPPLQEPPLQPEREGTRALRLVRDENRM